MIVVQRTAMAMIDSNRKSPASLFIPLFRIVSPPSEDPRER